MARVLVFNARATCKDPAVPGVAGGSGSVEVTIDDGIWAVRMGQAAQESASKGQAVLF